MRAAPQKRINEKALRVWRISAAISSIFGWLIFAGVLTLTLIFEWPIWIVWTLLALIVIESVVSIIIVPKIRWKRWRYEVLEHEVDLQYGLFTINRRLIPMVRVQHVDTQQGPILRKFKLATVTISTAAGTHEIPALDEVEADELRDFISKLARVVDEDDVI
ncbi:PH domain-containing protein [Bacillus luteolus]|uniref:PH domain-containing protein n=1 Tax=Litchfieldia luteola TaxID=682179 RepID=A0ABR9QME8_9BACI|nr:PH domain-containing protein [Cytobacillus luteolus]MBE4909673.1 PH domain-containing protein [Cytobacillus luteolus]MBP1944573.1 membrane protein YdbS with pleckstrin-like domain [Cytobacillus luteolus]